MTTDNGKRMRSVVLLAGVFALVLLPPTATSGTGEASTAGEKVYDIKPPRIPLRIGLSLVVFDRTC